jgi:spore germination protein GerM
MTRIRRRLAPALCAVAMAAALAACGVPISAGPRVLSRTQVQIAPPQTTVPVIPNPAFVTIFLLDGSTNLATPVTRAVPKGSNQLSTILNDLLLGPVPSSDHGLTTAIPSGTKLQSVVPDPPPNANPTVPVIVNFSVEFSLTSATSQVLAVQQVVFTIACDLTTTTRVLFEIEGQPSAVAIGSGAEVSRPVTAADYGGVTCPA